MKNGPDIKTAIICENPEKSTQVSHALREMGMTVNKMLRPADFKTVHNENFDLILAVLSPSDDKTEWVTELRKEDYEVNLVVITESQTEAEITPLLESGITDVIPFSHLYLLKFRFDHYRTHLAKHNWVESQTIKNSLDLINDALVRGESTASISMLVLEGIYETLGIERSRIYLYDELTDSLNLHAEKISRGLTQKLEERTGISMKNAKPVLTEDSVFKHVVRTKKQFITDDPEIVRNIVKEHTTNPLLKKLADWAIGLVGIKAFAIFPLLSGQKLMGLLSFSAPSVLTKEQIDTASRFALHASIVLGKYLDQKTLIQNEERFRAISNYTANWELWVDKTGKPVWINPGVEAMIGYTAEELLAMPDYFERLVHPDDYARVMVSLEDALKKQAEGGGLEFRIKHRNGKTMWFNISWRNIYDASGNWEGIRSSAVDITVQKQHETALLEQQAELREAQDIARLGSWKWNPVNESMYLTEPLCKVIGLTFRDEWFSRDYFLKNIVHPDSRETVEKAILNVRTQLEVKDLEVSVQNDQQQKITLLIRASEQAHNYHRLSIISGTALDITLLKKTHDESRVSESRFRKIFESIHDVYYQADSKGILVRVSPSVQNLLGYKPEELVGQPLSSFYSRQNMSDLKTTMQPSNQLDQFEVTLFHKNHSPVVVSINQSRISDPEGKDHMIHGLMRDITEKKKYEKSLENQRKRLLEIVKLNTQIIETSDQFFYVIQTASEGTFSEDQLRYISPQVNKMLGLGELQLLNMKNRWRDLIHPDDLEVYDASREHLALNKKPVRVSYRIKRSKPDEYIWTDEYACPLLDEENRVVEIYGSVKDVTERVNAIINVEHEKKQSMAYQYQLLSSQLNPHFIYNTLNSFQYYILQGNIEESLNHISDFSQLMRRVLENSMSQYITVDEEVLFLEQYIRISQKRMKNNLNFKIETDPEIDTGEIMIPPMLLQPYVENAIIHAFSNSPREPELYIAVYQDEHQIRCLIEDNGIGREHAMLNRNRESMDKKRSIAMNINQTRLNLLNQITDRNFKLNVEDRTDSYGNPCGTRVVITYDSEPQKVSSAIAFQNYLGHSKYPD